MYFTTALQSQCYEYSPNKGNGCGKKIRNMVLLYDAEAAHYLDKGLVFSFSMF